LRPLLLDTELQRSSFRNRSRLETTLIRLGTLLARQAKSRKRLDWKSLGGHTSGTGVVAAPAAPAMYHPVTATHRIKLRFRRIT